MKKNRTLEILTYLRASEGRTVSGETLGKAAGVSRAAVAKHVRNLEAAGYVIEHRHKAGYCLNREPAELNEVELFEGISEKFFSERYYYRELASTQDILKELAVKGAPEGTLVVGGSQSGGRGRLGRAWVSPRGGLWFSFILRPDISPDRSGLLSVITAYSAGKALDAFSLNARLKWPNDIFLNGKKIGGVLAESETEQDRVNWMVIGLGLNLNVEAGFFSGIPKASSVLAESGTTVKHRDFLNGFSAIFSKAYADVVSDKRAEVVQKAAERLLFVGEKVAVRQAGKELTGVLKGLSEEGEALMETAPGKVIRCRAGEINQ